jgi:hypothetical protein
MTPTSSEVSKLTRPEAIYFGIRSINNIRKLIMRMRAIVPKLTGAEFTPECKSSIANGSLKM